jgi:ankyrin repeat protein
MAAEHAALEQVQVLLGAGAPANARSPTGWTPLLLACLFASHVEHTDPGRLAEVVRILLEAGADPATAGVAPAARPAGLTALHYAAQSDIHLVVPLLVAHGADPNAVDREGRTALHWAAETGSLSPAEELLSCGASPLIRDDGGNTPADIAEREGHGEVAALLRAAESGAEAGGARDPGGAVPAAESGNRSELRG